MSTTECPTLKSSMAVRRPIHPLPTTSTLEAMVLDSDSIGEIEKKKYNGVEWCPVQLARLLVAFDFRFAM